MPPFASGKAAQQPPISPPFPPLNKFPIGPATAGEGERGARESALRGERGAPRGAQSCAGGRWTETRTDRFRRSTIAAGRRTDFVAVA